MTEFEVKTNFGVLGVKKDRHGDPCELRLCKVSWHGSKPMWDLRTWSRDEQPLKGITLTDGMMQELKSILINVDLDGAGS